MALTTKPLDKHVQSYRVGDLIEPQEQNKTDSDSLVSLPNRIRSDGENDYHNVRTKSDCNSTV